MCRTVADAAYVLDAIAGIYHNDIATIETSKKGGAVLVDNLKIANLTEICSSNDEYNALYIEFKISLNAYLKELVASPVRSLADAIAFNNKHQKLETIKEYGQDVFLAAEATNGFGKTEKPPLLNLARWTRYGLVKLMTEKKLDAVVTPKSDFRIVLAIGGAPGLTN
ncbi:probable amidase At4g34880 [Rosa chinensis]|uniref:probable amidase At4g34880 n=1 Tax=Rosa chinensis TaxID=74649 RepID=UPI000D08B864|nr:probable amidase At4g34880 [Rosa chinensis]